MVSGTAQLEASPDHATVRLGIVNQANTARQAQELTNNVAQQILAAITRIGIPAERIQTSRLTLTPLYDGNEPPRIRAYNASNVVTIDLDNLTQVGPVIDAGLGAGANRLDGVQFRLKNDLAVREQAIKQAVTEARRKAQAIAEALGVQLGPVLEVQESGVSVIPRGDMPEVMMARMQSDAAFTPVSPGQIDVHANVMIRFRIGN
jgi:uncharacterized protein YggE